MLHRNQSPKRVMPRINSTPAKLHVDCDSRTCAVATTILSGLSGCRRSRKRMKLVTFRAFVGISHGLRISLRFASALKSWITRCRFHAMTVACIAVISQRKPASSAYQSTTTSSWKSISTTTPSWSTPTSESSFANPFEYASEILWMSRRRRSI